MKSCISSLLVSLLLSGALAAPLVNEARAVTAEDFTVPADTSDESMAQVGIGRRAAEMLANYDGVGHQVARAYVPPAQLEADRIAYYKKMDMVARAEAYIASVEQHDDEYTHEKRSVMPIQEDDFLQKRELVQTVEDNIQTVAAEHGFDADLENRLKEAVKKQLKELGKVANIGKRDITSDLKGVADDFIKIFGSEQAFAPVLAQFKKELDESVKTISVKPKPSTTSPPPTPASSQQPAKVTVTTITQTQQVKENAAPTTTPPPNPNGLTPEEIADAQLQSSVDAVARSMIAAAEKKEADETAAKKVKEDTDKAKAADKKKLDDAKLKEEQKKKADEDAKKKKDEEDKKKKEEEDKKKAQVKVKDEKPAYNY
ncbi:hypothetical protein VHEMI08036 [[Torrubiella] hemipterigena]|uniref:Uncharacterized protein n=1 Tax=[Torrubiella] hemipterigena TaxID=1531966 RepID=A0A0A1T5D7_9HYPO|nr:hypothetical protein VHEMI08036 [[Torrubiella] hemipterigena]